MTIIDTVREALKKVTGDGQAKRNRLKKRGFREVNESLEPDSNLMRLSIIVFQNLLNASSSRISFITI